MTSSISAQLTMADYQSQIDTMNLELQQTIATQQDSTTANNTSVQAQQDAFAMSTIQPSQQN